MPERADVKIRGVIVGEVLGFSATDQGAKVRLGIFPEPAAHDPEQRHRRDRPEDAVRREVRRRSSYPVTSRPRPPCRPDAIIPRTEVPVEVQKVLADLYPLLRTVQPADINLTLNAISTALEGRGEALGRDLVTVDHYLKRVNPQIPQIVARPPAHHHGLQHLRRRDAGGRADPAQHHPDHRHPARTGTSSCRRCSPTSRRSPTRPTTSCSRTATTSSGSGRSAEPQAQMLARYAPEYPCLLGGLVKAGKREAAGLPRLHPAHRPRDAAAPAARLHRRRPARCTADNRGPNCLHLPNAPWSQSNPVRHQPNFNDGIDSPTGKGTDRVAPPYGGPSPAAPGTPAARPRRACSRACWAPRWAVPPQDVPDLGVLLVGPMARGAKVSLR